MSDSKWFRKLNFIVNILVVLVIAMLIGTFAYSAFFKTSLSSLEAANLSAGDNFKGLQEVNFEKYPNTILLIADTKCRYCTESLPFHKKIIGESKENPDVRVIAVFKNDKEETENYLQEYEIEVESISDVDLVKLGVEATPIVVLVNQNRKIVDSYQGFLNEKQQADFFKLHEESLSAK